jgi:hypothetical protein
VNSTSLSDALTPLANHAAPAATISAPVRLPGRRHTRTDLCP